MSEPENKESASFDVRSSDSEVRSSPLRRRAVAVAQWVDDRVHVQKLFASTAGHKVPKSSGSWFYVFGSATLLCFMIQVVTGIMLAMVYIPSAAEAYDSLEYLNHEVFLGWFLRAVHNWSALVMVVLMCIHMTQVYLFGAYKYPRELTWVSGVLLLFVTLGLAFTGQVLRFDQDAYWGLGIGASIMGRVPVIGESLVHLMLGGPIIAGETLTRFFVLHVFILPGLLIAIVSLHLRLVLSKGINEYPKPGQVVKKETYDQEYQEIIKKEGVPFVPKAINKDLVFGGFIILLILGMAAILGPAGPNGPPDPTMIDTVPRPDIPFLWIFAVAALLPPYLETPILLIGPAVAAVVLLALPFIDNTGEKSARRRPFAVLTVILVWVSLLTLTWLGHTSPWSPDMQAWTETPIDKEYLEDRTPVEMQGALVLQFKQCRNCHSIGGEGGHRGPDLTTVGARLTKDQLIRQVIQGGGNMPAYGKNLSPDQVDALVAYLQSLRPRGVAPARDPSREGRPTAQSSPEAE